MQTSASQSYFASRFASRGSRCQCQWLLVQTSACRYVAVDVLAVDFVRINIIICQSSSRGHFVHWHRDKWLEGLAEALGALRNTRTLSWEGPFRNMINWLVSPLLLAGTDKGCPLGGKRKSSAEGIRAVVRWMSSITHFPYTSEHHWVLDSEGIN